MNETTIVILTAMNLEYNAVRERLSSITTQTHPMGTIFETGHLGGSCRVALALTGKGNQSAAVAAERAAAEFAPAAIIFVGVAGSLQPHLGLGDVVVATHVYAYHGATSEDSGLTARPRTWEISYRAHQIAARLERTGSWTRRLPAGSRSGSAVPRVHFGPVAAGEIAHYSATSEARQWLREHYSDAIAVEMEAAGVAQAGHMNDALPTIMVRGISDYSDESKSATDDAGWQSRAAANAAAFAVALAAALAEEPDASARSRAGGPHGGGPTNIVADTARVGVQGQHVTVHGGIRIGGPDSGGDTARFATADLDERTVRPGRLTLALNRVGRFFRGIAELAAGVTTVVTAIRNVT
jgi:adenosylhomocysteine nucleosidase